jgi:hypothetical protein
MTQAKQPLTKELLDTAALDRPCSSALFSLVDEGNWGHTGLTSTKYAKVEAYINMTDRPAKNREMTMPAILTCDPAVQAYVRKEATRTGMNQTVPFNLIY